MMMCSINQMKLHTWISILCQHCMSMCVELTCSSTRQQVEDNRRIAIFTVLRIDAVKPATCIKHHLISSHRKSHINRTNISRDGQASLGYSDSCLRCDGRPPTSVVCDAQQWRQWLACPKRGHMDACTEWFKEQWSLLLLSSMIIGKICCTLDAIRISVFKQRF